MRSYTMRVEVDIDLKHFLKTVVEWNEVQELLLELAAVHQEVARQAGAPEARQLNEIAAKLTKTAEYVGERS